MTALRSSRHGFTLIEVLAAFAIIGILASVLLVSMPRVKQSAEGANCLNNLRQVGAAIALYTSDHNGTLPGQCDNSIRTSYRINRNDLGAFLAPYWGLPEADTVTRYAPVLTCPSWKRIMKRDEGLCYVSPFRLKGLYNPDNPTGYYGPFGKAQPDGQPLRIQILNGIPGYQAAQQWMIQDMDRLNQPQLALDGQAVTPVHGKFRNVLFFDYHVEAVPASTILN